MASETSDSEMRSADLSRADRSARKGRQEEEEEEERVRTVVGGQNTNVRVRTVR